MIGHFRGKGRILAVIFALGLAACSATFTNHGYIPDDDELAGIIPGLDSQSSVEDLVGRPSASGVISGSTWFYVASRQRHFAYNAPEVIERQIVAISFDERGTVENIRELDLEDGQVVRFSRRVTDSNIQEVTFLRQLFSNFGRINIGEALSN